MKRFRAVVEIEAPMDRVWAVLTDFDAYPRWNPYIRSASGEFEVGQRLNIHLEPTGGKGTNLRLNITKVESNREMRWVGNVVGSLLRIQFVFTLQPLRADRLILVCREILFGPFDRFILPRTLRDHERGLREMVKAIRRQAESR